MRKLNKKNKSIIVILSALFIGLFSLLIIFIIYNKNSDSTKYSVNADSLVYTSSLEKVKVSFEDAYVKEDLIGRYYLYDGDESYNLGYNSTLYDKKIDSVLLFGDFINISLNGNIEKISGYNILKDMTQNFFYKISDRLYLITGNNITSSDKSLSTNKYLIINIDKQGNGFLYNHDVSFKSFSDLVIKAGNFEFNVKEELLTIGGENVDLKKINGSSNEYVKKESGSGSGNGSGSSIYNEPVIETKIETKNAYVQSKTSVIDYIAYVDKVEVNYIAYDPLLEYTKLYAEVYESGNKIYEVILSKESTNVVITGLSPAKKYTIKFYYSYISDGNEVNSLFDTIFVTTKSVTGSILLESISGNIVKYKVKIDDYILDSAKVLVYVDSSLVDTKEINTTLAKNGGYEVTSIVDTAGDFVTLKLSDCIYNGSNINIDASYKYKK